MQESSSANNINIIEEDNIQLQSSNLPKVNILKLTKKKSTRNNEHPGKRWGHSVVIHDKKMILFGGRHNKRSLATLYSLDFNSLTWNKIEPYGQCPPARDSHSVLMYKNEMIIFGGSGFGKKLNDLWSFNFNQKKWTKINPTGEIPCPLEGPCVALIRNCYMMVYGGLDENDKDTNAIYLLDLRNNFWILATSIGAEPELRDSQSLAMINNTCYVFGGQDNKDQRYNDMHLLNFEINETDKVFKGVWTHEDIQGKKPQTRTSHSSIAYKDQYIFIIGGEGDDQMPLNDLWVYDIHKKEYNEIILESASEFEGRLCHSCILFNEIIVIYGGMKNVEQTLDNLVLFCFETQVTANTNTNAIEDINLNHNNQQLDKGTMSNDQENIASLKLDNTVVEQKENSQLINEYNSNNDLLFKAISDNKITRKEISTDTYDLNDDNMFIFSNVKQKALNRLISWSFLKQMTSMYQWPLGCIGAFIQNSLKHSVQAHNVYIDIKGYNTKCYQDDIKGDIIMTNSNCNGNTNPGIDLDPSSLKHYNASNHKLVLSIIDDGLGISHIDFNEMMNSASKNAHTEYTFLTKGLNLKLLSLRLANGLFIITKHNNKELSIGLLSKNLQRTLDLDLLVTPIVQWTINGDDNQSLSSSNPLWTQTLNLILQEIYFLFPNRDSLYDYFKTFTQGTHIFLYDLKQVIDRKEYINQLHNYELQFDYEAKDIYYCNKHYDNSTLIDNSLKVFLSYMFLEHPLNAKIYILNKEIAMSNPYKNLYLYSKINTLNCKEISKLSSTSLNNSDDKVECIYIDNMNEYNGFLISLKAIETNKELKEKIEMNEEYSPEYNNGILIYKDNILVCRLNQKKFGDGLYNNKTLITKAKAKKSIIGYIELNHPKYELLSNKFEIKDKAQQNTLFSKLYHLISHINTS